MLQIQNRSSLVRRLAAVAAAAATAGWATPAAATVAWGGASFTDLVFEVIDLRPGDGIAAGYQFAGEGYSNTQAHRYSVGVPGSIAIDSNGPYYDGFNAWRAYTAEVPGAVSTATPIAGGVDVKAWSDRPDLFFAGGAQTLTLGGPEGLAAWGLELNPYTSIVVSVLATTFAAMTSDFCPDAGSCGTVTSQVNLGGRTLSTALYGESIFKSQTGFGQFVDSDTGRVSLTLTNNTGLKDLAFLQLGAGLSGTPVAPVPEPETWAMMLGGLAGLGAWARRRKQKSEA